VDGFCKWTLDVGAAHPLFCFLCLSEGMANFWSRANSEAQPGPSNHMKAYVAIAACTTLGAGKLSQRNGCASRAAMLKVVSAEQQ